MAAVLKHRTITIITMGNNQTCRELLIPRSLLMLPAGHPVPMLGHVCIERHPYQGLSTKAGRALRVTAGACTVEGR